MGLTFEPSAQAIQHRGHTALRAFMPLTDGADIGAVHVAMAGSWAGHGTGPFEFTGETFDNIIRLFEIQRNPMPVDFEHQSMDHELAGPKIAAGWIQKLRKRKGPNGPELWATVEWTAKAAEMIRAGEYRFTSPVIDFESIDRKTDEEVGPEMLNLALTNNPFLDGQSPIQLTRAKMAEHEDDEKNMAEHEDDETKTKRMAEHEDDEKDMAEHEDDKKDMAHEGDEADFTSFGKALAEATGQDSAATLAALIDNTDKIAEMINMALEQDGTAAEASRLSRLEARVKGDQVKALSKKIADLEKREDRRTDEALAAEVDAKIAAGYIKPDLREDAIWLFKTDRTKATKLFSEKLVPVGLRQGGDDPKVKPEDVSFDSLSERDKGAVKMMVAAKFKGGKQAAIARVVKMRREAN